MLALLKLIPLKDWIYAALIAVLLAGFGVYTVHERHIGEQKIEAADSKAVAAEKAHDQAVEKAAQDQINASVAKYTQALAAPTLPVPSIVCRAAGSSGPVSSVPGSAGSGNGAPVVPESTGPEFNPSLHVLEIGRQADAQVNLLQAYIRSLQAAGVAAK